MLQEKTLFEEPAVQFAAGVLAETFSPATRLDSIETNEFQMGRTVAQLLPSFPLKMLVGTAASVISIAEHYDLHPDPDLTPWDYVP